MAPQIPSPFPSGITFTYIPPTGSLDLTACGLPTKYDASAAFSSKKAVLVAVPGAFTPTCQVQHVQSYINKLPDLKKAGVEQVVFIASNDAWVMAAWGKANGVQDESIIFASDDGLNFSKSIGWTQGDRTLRYAIVVDHGKMEYAEVDTEKGSIAKSGADAVLGVLAKL